MYDTVPRELSYLGLLSDRGLHGAVGLERLQELGKTEIDDLRNALFGHHDVGGFQVSMNDPLLVGFGKTVGHVTGQAESALRGKGSARQDVAQLLALDQLHRDEVDAIDFVDFVNGGDIGVFEGVRGLSFFG